MKTLNILSGGAAQGLVRSLEPAFEAETGLGIAGDFGAVGAMADRLRAGVPTDIVILTAALIAKLADEGLVLRSSITDIGRVETALAVRAGDPLVSADDAASLRAALLAADAIFVPDTKASTAGIHVAKLLAQIDVADVIADRLRVFPNGATAMRYLAESNDRRPIGCTQSTEIISTKGVVLSGPLPPGCGLATMYTAAIPAHASSASPAQRLIALLTSSETSERRSQAGFVSGLTS
ncbi:ABC-type molybdate transport system substrate-binding protein [Bradyrhizobium japonicum]|uniref:molybdate ABC transporter substrate-binding protein n=1 Tax=Bradyrhizobium elkanii TaxID=29448 RepID=UPI0003622E28|nr:substrate-binding domain-containing protein [Bradyrhizobium elkanii]MCW2111848.1 molybdate transport system substrate-binding protein [Bradyrhizobium elkanii]NWL41250.1 ABC transporter substrate-binding protein [Bradyrhizobium elkanii]RYM17658.1 ABC transporter substrate-binding protein [Bradyrhizobium elkanii]UQD84136.1 substrate-binding domain-containing protein [Bradyrhizobium elkanii USDA 76]GEC53031.1 molybdate ABC transporter substrate-binding protein [Bradyrhizobium elkanii]